MMRVDQISDSWARHLDRDAPIGLGLDVATTTKSKSNPSSLTVMQKMQRLYVQRLILRWKSDDEAVSRAIISRILDDIKHRGITPKSMCIDASNETFFAQALRAQFRGRCMCYLIKGGETIEWKGMKYSGKELLGSLYVNSFEDGFMALPREEWVMTDHRLVVRDTGSFRADIGIDGGHADTFDSGKLALWSFERSGPITAEAVQVGGGGEHSERGPLQRLWKHFTNRPLAS